MWKDLNSIGKKLIHRYRFIAALLNLFGDRLLGNSFLHSYNIEILLIYLCSIMHLQMQGSCSGLLEAGYNVIYYTTLISWELQWRLTDSFATYNFISLVCVYILQPSLFYTYRQVSNLLSAVYLYNEMQLTIMSSGTKPHVPFTRSNWNIPLI
jgi:hypothetical protein